ncbi:MAG TPA: hypothetical protein VEU77_10795 [Candidatus Acidoferrales bacterium]|nr:hypothetical protein [Candidatus Acidoferrales bacterium]
MAGTSRRWIGLSGIGGSIALTVYFAAPAFLGWPYAGAPATDLAAYASSRATLFYAGAWFQTTGTLLSVVFFIGLVALSGSSAKLSGLLTTVAATSLLALVLVEAALLVAVPMAATTGDLATVATTFALSNGTFVRVFAIGPAPASYLALGAMLRDSRLLAPGFANGALLLGVAFAAAGVVAVFATAGLIVTIVLSILQELWTVAAAVAVLRGR